MRRQFIKCLGVTLGENMYSKIQPFVKHSGPMPTDIYLHKKSKVKLEIHFERPKPVCIYRTILRQIMGKLKYPTLGHQTSMYE